MIAIRTTSHSHPIFTLNGGLRLHSNRKGSAALARPRLIPLNPDHTHRNFCLAPSANSRRRRSIVPLSVIRLIAQSTSLVFILFCAVASATFFPSTAFLNTVQVRSFPLLRLTDRPCGVRTCGACPCVASLDSENPLRRDYSGPTLAIRFLPSPIVRHYHGHAISHDGTQYRLSCGLSRANSQPLEPDGVLPKFYPPVPSVQDTATAGTTATILWRHAHAARRSWWSHDALWVSPTALGYVVSRASFIHFVIISLPRAHLPRGVDLLASDGRSHASLA